MIVVSEEKTDKWNGQHGKREASVPCEQAHPVVWRAPLQPSFADAGAAHAAVAAAVAAS